MSTLTLGRWLLKCQLMSTKVGRWSKWGKNWSTQFLNAPQRQVHSGFKKQLHSLLYLVKNSSNCRFLESTSKKKTIFLGLVPLDQGETKQTHTFWQACFTVQTHRPTFDIIGLRICLISSITSSTSFKQGCLSWVILVLHTSSKALSGVNNPTRIPNHVHQFIKCLKCRRLIFLYWLLFFEFGTKITSQTHEIRKIPIFEISL